MCTQNINLIFYLRCHSVIVRQGRAVFVWLDYIVDTVLVNCSFIFAFKRELRSNAIREKFIEKNVMYVRNLADYRFKFH